MKKILFTLFTFLISSGVYSQTLKIGDKVHGGIVAYIDDTGKHGLVCSFGDLGSLDWNGAKKACEEYKTDGFSDWYLPSKDELNLLYENLHKKGLGDFDNYRYYWSSTEGESGFAWIKYFDVKSHSNLYGTKSNYYNARAVRAF